MTEDGIRLYIHPPGALRDLQRALKETADETPKAIQTAHKAVAGIVVAEAQRNAAGTTLAARIRAFGTTRNAGVRFLGHKPRGKSRATDALLQEFGGRAPLFGNRDHWHTVKPKRKSGYLIYPAIRDTRQKVMDAYLDELDQAIRRHWDD